THNTHDKNPNTFSTLSPPSNELTMTPATTGINTICTIEMNISMNDTGSSALASNKVSSGVTTGASSVEIEVAAIETATLPFARNVMTLDEVPPGVHPTSMTPIAISAVSWKSHTSSTEMSGMTIYCAATVNSTAFGALTTSLKSPSFKVSPIPNMMIPRRIEI